MLCGAVAAIMVHVPGTLLLVHYLGFAGAGWAVVVMRTAHLSFTIGQLPQCFRKQLCSHLRLRLAASAPAVQGLPCCCSCDIAHEDDCASARSCVVGSHCAHTSCKEAEVGWDDAQTGAIMHVTCIIAVTRCTVLHCPVIPFKHTTWCSMCCMQAVVVAFLLTDCTCCGCSVFADSGQAILQT